MDRILTPTLVNAAAEGIGCGDFSLDHVKVGDQVKLLAPIGAVASRPENRAAVWVKVTEVKRHPLPDYCLFAGVVAEVCDLGETGLEQGDVIRFARCNIVEVA